MRKGRFAPEVACCPPDSCPPDTGAPPAGSDEEIEADLAALARAIGHPARARILRVLLVKDTCVAGELAGELPLAASTVSQHLKILKEAGLIKGEVDGPRRCYCVDRSVLARLEAAIGWLLAPLHDALHNALHDAPSEAPSRAPRPRRGRGHRLPASSAGADR